MTRTGINRVSLFLPLAFSAVAFVVVMANIAAGVGPQPDETSSAHLWQLLIVLQLPFVLLFLATAEWRTMSPALLFGLQLAAIGGACIPVWLAGF